MAITYADRVKETTTTTGTGALALGGAVTVFQSFSSGVGVGNKTYYLVVGGAEWEIGQGTLSGAAVLTRDTVYSSSNSGALVSLSAGSKIVLATAPTVFVNAATMSKSLPLIAGEAIAAFQAVYINRSDGKVFLTDADILGRGVRGVQLGIATEAIVSGGTGLIAFAGVVTGFSSLNPGRMQYLGSVFGSIVETPPGTNIEPVGIAVGRTQILLFTETQSGARLPLFEGFKGYCGGGESAAGVSVSTSDRTVFATNTTGAATTADISVARVKLSGIGSFNLKGYFTGGSPSKSDIVFFSTDVSYASTVSVLSLARQEQSSMSERNVKGYIAGGATSAVVATADKVTFATDAVAAQTTANVSVGKAAIGGLTDGVRQGYWLGGYTGSTVGVANCDVILFANDITAAKTTVVLATGMSHPFVLSNGVSKGWVGGGQSGVAVALAAIYRLTFASDVMSAALSAVLTAARYGSGCFSQGNTKGYILGGRSSLYLNTANVFTFSTEAISAVVNSNLTTVRAYVGSCSDTAL